MKYMFQWLVGLLFIGCINTWGSQDESFYFNPGSKISNGNCKPKGYNGGKLEVVIKKIEAPIAELEASFFESFFDISKKTSESLKYFTDEAKTSLEAVQETLKNAKPLIAKLSKVSRCLGLFGFAFGLLSDFNEPSPEDILKASNTAIKKLTNEVNDKFTDMKDYVDGSILDIRKDIVRTKYLAYESMFKLCGEQYIRRQLPCTERLFILIQSDFNSFRPKVSEIDRWDESNKPSINAVKEIEVNFEFHRMYCTLYLKVGGVLFQSYENLKTAQGKFSYAKYAKDIKEGAEACIKYANFGYKWILDIHLNRNNCEKSLTCTDPEPIKEGGWFKAHTTDLYRCSCVYDGAQKGTDVCFHKVGLRYDGKSPSDWDKVTRNKNSLPSRDDIAKEYAGSLLKKGEEKYVNEARDFIEEYWNTNAMNQVPIWKAISNKFDKIIRDLPPVATPPVKKVSESDKKYLEGLFEKAQKYASAFVEASENPESQELESEEYA